MNDRFLADDPAVLPSGASPAERLKLQYPTLPPPPDTPDAARWTLLNLQPPVGGTPDGQDS